MAKRWTLGHVVPGWWTAGAVALLDRLVWARSRFLLPPTRAERTCAALRAVSGESTSTDFACSVIERILQRVATAGDFFPADLEAAVLRKAHPSFVAAASLRPGPHTAGPALVVSVMRARLLEPALSPLVAVVRDLGWIHVPDELVSLAAEAALFSVGLASSEAVTGALYLPSIALLPKTEPGRTELLESVADSGCGRDVDRPREQVAAERELMHGLLGGGRSLERVDTVLRRAVRRWATGSFDAALLWVTRARAELQPDENSSSRVTDTIAAIEAIEHECRQHAVVAISSDLLDPRAFDDDEHMQVHAAQLVLDDVAHATIERIGDSDPAEIRGGLEQMCHEVEELLHADPSVETAIVLAWMHVTLSELVQLDGEVDRWRFHKRRQLDLEDEYGVALGEAGLGSDGESVELVVPTPPPEDRALACDAEAERALEAGDALIAEFWLDRAKHYRA